MAKHKSMFDKNYRQHIGATVAILTTFLAFVFLTTGAPLGQLVSRAEGSKGCYTLWGLRDDCSSPAYSWRIAEETCHDKRRRLEAAEAFIIMGIFGLLVQFLFVYYQLCDEQSYKMILVLLSLFSVGCTTVPWAVVTAFYYTPFCGEKNFMAANVRFSTGYILILVSFALQVIGCFAIIVFEEDAYEQNERMRSETEAKNRAALEDVGGKKKPVDTSSSSSD
ncbi:amastin-like surface protein-like protein [Strigomonas culicis]|uniref:Amastin-like surface protein-like protein n=1 Tax=Strigomonas culicis TaxID=28005 RepID=S9UXE2_9TRYP|nr:amastin-like surface protein-like protein [Strigomonas culicis]|eukprot:EPY33434.1 amastin-like surface protein-like protein [Strigomonas culicis]